MYIKTVKVRETHGSLYIISSYFVAPISEEIFAVLGEDRILYTPIDSEIGKEYAVRIVKKTGWNVKKLKVGRLGRYAVYFIPKSFAKSLGINKREYVLVVGKNGSLEVFPLRIVLQKLGEFREPLI